MINVKLGQTIYLLGYFKDSISKVTVRMIGDDDFAHSYTFNSLFIEEFRKPCTVDEEGTRWFRKLADAKAYIKSKHPKCVIKKIEEDYWEVQER